MQELYKLSYKYCTDIKDDLSNWRGVLCSQFGTLTTIKTSFLFNLVYKFDKICKCQHTYSHKKLILKFIRKCKRFKIAYTDF